jgi:hypothetical protein
MDNNCNVQRQQKRKIIIIFETKISLIFPHLHCRGPKYIWKVGTAGHLVVFSNVSLLQAHTKSMARLPASSIFQVCWSMGVDAICKVFFLLVRVPTPAT